MPETPIRPRAPPRWRPDQGVPSCPSPRRMSATAVRMRSTREMFPIETRALPSQGSSDRCVLQHEEAGRGWLARRDWISWRISRPRKGPKSVFSGPAPFRRGGAPQGRAQWRRPRSLEHAMLAGVPLSGQRRLITERCRPCVHMPRRTLSRIGEGLAVMIAEHRALHRSTPRLWT